MDEISQLKREKELLERSIVNKDAEILDIHKQCEASSSAARTADNKIRLLESQVRSCHSHTLASDRGRSYYFNNYNNLRLIMIKTNRSTLHTVYNI